MDANTSITEDMVQLAEDAGACDEGLRWLRAAPRTFEELASDRPKDFRWALEWCNVPTFLEYALENHARPEVVQAIAYNRYASAEILHACAERATVDDVRRSIACHRNSSSPTLALLAQSTTDPCVLYNVAYHPNTPPEVLTQLARHEDSAVTSAVLCNPNSPPAAIHACRITAAMISAAENANACPEALAWLSEKPRTIGDLRKERFEDLIWALGHCDHPALLAHFAQDKNMRIREAVAYNRYCPPSTADRLANDRSSSVRYALVQSKAVTVARIVSLANDPAVTVRVGVAHSTRAPTNLLHQLRLDPSPEVRRALAYNKNLPLRTLGALRQDKDPTVREVAKWVAKHLPPAITEAMIASAVEVGACPEALAWLRAAPRTFEELRKERLGDFLWALRRTNIPELIDYAITNNPSGAELRYIASNPFASPEVLLTCARGVSASRADDASYRVVFHPNAPAEALAIAFARNERSSAVTRAIARNNNATPELLHAVAHDPACCLDAKLAIANNPRATTETLDYLRQDETHAAVAVAAARNLQSRTQ